jgi:hypothetical protein
VPGAKHTVGIKIRVGYIGQRAMDLVALGN